MDEQHIYLYPYTYENMNLITGWNVMISPEGEIYKIYERDDLVTGHDFFAERIIYTKYKKDYKKIWSDFQNKNPKFSSVNLGAKDILINFFGFVNYEYDANLDIKGPEYFYAGLKVTNKQILIVQKLILLNNDNKKVLSDFIKRDDKYSKYL